MKSYPFIYARLKESLADDSHAPDDIRADTDLGAGGLRLSTDDFPEIAKRVNATFVDVPVRLGAAELADSGTVRDLAVRVHNASRDLSEDALIAAVFASIKESMGMKPDEFLSPSTRLDAVGNLGILKRNLVRHIGGFDLENDLEPAWEALNPKTVGDVVEVVEKARS